MNKLVICNFSFVLVTLFFSSCEKISSPNEVENYFHEQNKSDETPEPVSIKVPDSEPIKNEEDPLPATPSPEIKKPSKVSEQTATLPEDPQFSEDLLDAVKNWTKVPKSVFPAKPILSSVPVNLVAKTSSGQIIANSTSPPGSELQVLGMKGSTLIVANANNSKLRGEVDIDQTDFKQLLAYRFELNKRKKAKADAMRRQKEHSGNIAEKPSTTSKIKPREKVEEIPDPLDFGHGRFCICKDCREKRLAKTGSLKTGFGLEP